MSSKNAVVFGSTGFQGLPQVRELLRRNYSVRAVSRHPSAFATAEFSGVEAVSADYEDYGSLNRALEGMDAMLFQAPAMGDPTRLMHHCQNLIDATLRSGIRLVVINSSMWAPDTPCGDMVYDGVAAMETLFTDSGLPCIIFRPTLFMDNLQGAWIKPQIAGGTYPYCHKPGMEADWICLDDVAKFMVAALERPDLVGRKLRLGGPQRLTTLQMLEIISDFVGRDVVLDYKTPREFGEFFWHSHGQTTGLDREAFIAEFESFYTFNNDSPLRPFQADIDATLALIPIELTTMREWAASRNWAT